MGALEAVTAGASAIVQSAVGVGGDVGGAARSPVEGAIAGVWGLGLSAEQAAAAATGALKAAGEIGSAAVEEVRKVATGQIGGVRVVAGKTPGT